MHQYTYVRAYIVLTKYSISLLTSMLDILYICDILTVMHALWCVVLYMCALHGSTSSCLSIHMAVCVVSSVHFSVPTTLITSLHPHLHLIYCSPPPSLSSIHPVIVTFNRYVKLNGDVVGTGGCVRHRHDEHVTKITDSTPVIRLLSTDDSREGGKNDWLCLIMKDIVSAHARMHTHRERDSYIIWLNGKFPYRSQPITTLSKW